MPNLLKTSNLTRFLFFLICDTVIIAVSLYMSFLLRFDFTIPDEYLKLFIRAFPFFFILKLSLFIIFRMYKITWRYVGLNDLQNIILALTASEALLMVLILIPLPPPINSYLSVLLSFDSSLPVFPRSIFLIDWILSVILLSGLRISKRVYLELIIKKRFIGRGTKTLIIGAGNTGEMILRDIARQNFSDFYPVGFLDDDTRKIGAYIHGIKVIGSTDKLKDSIMEYGVESIIIAIPSLNHRLLRDFYEAAKAANVGTVKIVPRIYDFHKPDINMKSLEDISIEDLIGRQAVNIDFEEIERFLLDKVMLVTGAGGSIGSEIVMQACAFKPSKLILFDIDETELHNMELRLKKTYPDYFKEAVADRRIFFAVGDIRDNDRVKELFNTYEPQIVFHAAAYKHVPMMESNAQEAVKVNILGTYNLAMAALKSKTDKFIMISTDKAVRPTSIMGATKRIAEYICQAFENNSSQPSALSHQQRKTEFISVRFGNVLGSRGSVLPLFLQQLKEGGPLTITHKDMQRYFMTIPEAVSLVLQASVIGKGGEVLVLDMGEPVRIVQLAEELILLHGMEPYKDIDIKFVGLRPGEKLFEEILTAEEGTVASRHKKVFIARTSERYSNSEIEAMLKEFYVLSTNTSHNANTDVKYLLRKYVKHFNEV